MTRQWHFHSRQRSVFFCVDMNKYGKPSKIVNFFNLKFFAHQKTNLTDRVVVLLNIIFYIFRSRKHRVWWYKYITGTEPLSFKPCVGSIIFHRLFLSTNVFSEMIIFLINNCTVLKISFSLNIFSFTTVTWDPISIRPKKVKINYINVCAISLPIHKFYNIQIDR